MIRKNIYIAWTTVQEYSLWLFIGAVFALIWANTLPDSYSDLQNLHMPTFGVLGHVHTDVSGESHRVLTVKDFVTHVLFALFFLLVGKEIFEARTAKNGHLRGRGALSPMLAAIGGVIGPAVVFSVIIKVWGLQEASSGWAIPTATDIAFAALFGRIIFGSLKHPAVVFLLSLAIVDDIVGVVILGIFYPQQPVQPEWLILSAVSVLFAFIVFNWLPRWYDKHNSGKRHITDKLEEKLGLIPYMCCACVSWYGFQEAGVHSALGLLPIVFAVPHGQSDTGYFEEPDQYVEKSLLDRLGESVGRFEGAVLFTFGLLSAGIAVNSIGPVTGAVMTALLFGKLIGVYIFGLIGFYFWGLSDGMNKKDLIVVGLVSSVGFTVALFVADAAFGGMSVILAEAKMGALLSLLFGLLAIVVARFMKVGKVPHTSSTEGSVSTSP